METAHLLDDPMTPSAASEKLEPTPDLFVRVAGAQPIPGYRLLELIGRGWAGEVWKCEAPGGLLKAVKFVHGICELHEGDSSVEDAEAIQRIKSIRHPFLMSLERAEFVGGDLVMVTELADRDLKDVWSCFQREGRPGIPRDQLLNYLREAAETLDLVNTQHNLQHLDLKPSNLFLVCNHIKIGDFGLVVSLFGKGASPKGLSRVVTPYMSPEVIEGGSHRQSDQYSLAVTYQEMITGVLPFHGTTPEVLRQEHLRGCPDLEALPVADRSVVARALAKDPQLRFPSCSEFIKALVLGHIEVSISPSVAVNPTTETDTSAVPELESEAAPAMSTTDTDRTDGISETPATMDLPVPPADDDGELPIYQFVRCLNRTPLTEVWDVHTSSGRRRVAKILFGPAGACSAALNRLLSLRHPVLAPLEFVQNTPGRLVLVSDPVKKNLRDCFQEYRAKGQPGIPRQQLLGYLKEAASALTDLSRKERLQHLGLNPRNLFLAGDKVRIADFGIAQLLWLPIGEPVSRMNPRYSAPELVQRRLSPSCDQYSLALIYHEMLTGYLPQTAGTSQPVVLSDLNALPESERAVIARAIDRDPKNRWETCLDLIQALESPRLSAPHADAEPLAARQVLVATPVEEEPVSRATDATEPLIDSPVPAVFFPRPSTDAEPHSLPPIVEAAIKDAPAAPEKKRFPNVGPDSNPVRMRTGLESGPTGIATDPTKADEDSLAEVQNEPERSPEPSMDVTAPAGELRASIDELREQALNRAESLDLHLRAAPPLREAPKSFPALLLPAMGSAQSFLETRFGVNLSATTVRHRLDGVRRQWNGREVRGDSENLVFLMKPPRSFWQQFAAKLVALEVHIHLRESPSHGQAPTEVDVAIMPPSDDQELADPVAKTLGQMLLESIRTALQVSAKGRGNERLIWPHALKIWPVHSGGRLGEPVDCQGKDLSLNGIGFYMPGDPPPKVIRLQLPKTDQTPAMTVPARVVRVQSFGDGWHEVGALLLMR